MMRNCLLTLVAVLVLLQCNSARSGSNKPPSEICQDSRSTCHEYPAQFGVTKDVYCQRQWPRVECKRFCGVCNTSDRCDYGSVNRIMGQGVMQGKTCSELLAQRGPGVCDVTQGDGLAQPISKQCCQECVDRKNVSQGCDYDDGKVLSATGDVYVTCSEYTSTHGYTECAEKEFSEVCCKTCVKQAARMRERCPADWKYSFLFNKCYKTHHYLTYQAAVDYCAEIGGHLPIPNNLRESNRLTRLHGWHRQAWLGLVTKLVDGQYKWTWISGQPLTWNDWIKGEQKVDKELCAYTTSAGWGMTSCSGEKIGICIRDVAEDKISV